MTHPQVSVVIPVHNGEEHLADAITSVLSQGYEPLQVIVVDDGSTDATRDLVGSFAGMTYIFQENQGPALARNTGIAEASGELIAFLDADDRWLPGKLDAQVSFHLSHPEVGYSVTHQRLVVRGDAEHAPWLKERLLQQDHVGFFPSSMMVRKEVFERIGVYDPTLTHAENADWIARAKDADILHAILEATLLEKHVHEKNMSHELPKSRAQMLRVLKASMNRQRGGP